MNDAETLGGRERATETAAADMLAGVGDRTIRGELRDIERAVDKGWNVPTATRQKLLERLATIINDPDTTTRTLLAIGRLLHSLNGQDLEVCQPAPAAGSVNVGTMNVMNLTPDQMRTLADADRLLSRASDAESIALHAGDGGGR